jgi:hypothetical protein
MQGRSKGSTSLTAAAVALGSAVTAAVMALSAPATVLQTANAATSHEPTTTTTTEPGATAPTIDLSCVLATSGPTITCNWAPTAPFTFQRYVLLKGQAGQKGRVLSPNPGTATSYVDTTVANPATYSYVVVALRADGTVAAHSGQVFVTCCPPPSSSTPKK